MDPTGQSQPITSRRVLPLLADLDWTTASVVDVGAGRGYFCDLLGETLRARGLEPAQHLSACDLFPTSFEYQAIRCEPIASDGRLPFAENRFDAAVSIEVIEHVENQFAFLRELARVVRPGGRVIVTTPNTLNTNSRVRTLLTGFPLLFDPLPVATSDPRRLSGHIHPISPYYLAYGALRAGLEQPSFHADRTKTSGALYTLLLGPAIWLGALALRRRLRRKRPEAREENQALLDMLASWDLLTSRTAVLRAFKKQ